VESKPPLLEEPQHSSAAASPFTSANSSSRSSTVHSSADLETAEALAAAAGLDLLAQHLRSSEQLAQESFPLNSRLSSPDAASAEVDSALSVLCPAAEREVRRLLASKDYSSLEPELRAIVASARTDAARGGASSSLKGHSRAMLRPMRGGVDDGSAELVVIREGSRLPVLRRKITAAELERARAVFDEWDTFHDGLLDLQEFSRVLRLIGRSPKTTTAAAMFELADLDGSGSLDFAEFALIFTGAPHLHAITGAGAGGGGGVGVRTLKVPRHRPAQKRAPAPLLGFAPGVRTHSEEMAIPQPAKAAHWDNRTGIS